MPNKKPLKATVLSPAPQGFDALVNIEADIAAGRSLWQVLGLPSERMDQYFDYAIELVEEKRADDASDILYLLCHLAPENATYWLTYGYLQHERKDYDSAFLSYEAAIELEPGLVEAYIMRAHLALEEGEPDVAQETLDLLKERCNQDMFTQEEKEELKELEEHLLGDI